MMEKKLIVALIVSAAILVAGIIAWNWDQNNAQGVEVPQNIAPMEQNQELKYSGLGQSLKEQREEILGKTQQPQIPVPKVDVSQIIMGVGMLGLAGCAYQIARSTKKGGEAGTS